MWWILLTAWVLLSPLLGLLIGTAIRLAAAASPAVVVESSSEDPCPLESLSRPESELVATAHQERESARGACGQARLVPPCLAWTHGSGRRCCGHPLLLRPGLPFRVADQSVGAHRHVPAGVLGRLAVHLVAHGQR